jgi:uncharacterized membrane protein YbaN (DUF454 family)
MRALKIALGVSMVGLGVVGLFLPFLQGVLFLLIGLGILSSESRRVRRLLDRLRNRYPDVSAAERRAMRWLKEKLHVGTDREGGSDQGTGEPKA